MARQRPEFVVICGDIVYSSGLVSEYFKNFWPVYNNVAEPGPTAGAPIMASVPFYGVLGNHDVRALSLAGKPDGFGAFYFFHGPLNGPKKLTPFTVKPEKPEEVAIMKNAAGNPHPGFLHVLGGKEEVAAFQAAVGANYPGLCHYSWDNGAVHCVALDANRYTNPLDPLLQRWLREDLLRSKAAWKLVFFHQPGFNASAKHWAEQRMRLLAPLFEECGVNVVFAGHVHNYQRSLPLKFKPGNPTSKGEVPGKFTVDTQFDGVGTTRPNGVIYIVTGGGGASLYDQEFTDSPAKWKRENGEPNYTAKFISDRHSFTVVEADAAKLVLRQVDDAGKEADAVTITK
jgi:predicted phosphodiesterase